MAHTVPPSSSDVTARQDWRVLRPGSARGNALCVSGRSFQGFPTRCWVISAGPVGLIHEIGLPAHRAMPDAYVTAHHLRDELNAASLDKLLFRSSEPGILPGVRAGPDRGKSWERLSVETLTAFTRDRDADIGFSADTESAARRNASTDNVRSPSRRFCD